MIAAQTHEERPIPGATRVANDLLDHGSAVTGDDHDVVEFGEAGGNQRTTRQRRSKRPAKTWRGASQGCNVGKPIRPRVPSFTLGHESYMSESQPVDPISLAGSDRLPVS
jgi:hypothetical protein